MEEQHKLLRMQEQTRTRMQGEAVSRGPTCELLLLLLLLLWCWRPRIHPPTPL